MARLTPILHEFSPENREQVRRFISELFLIPAVYIDDNLLATVSRAYNDKMWDLEFRERNVCRSYFAITCKEFAERRNVRPCNSDDLQLELFNV